MRVYDLIQAALQKAGKQESLAVVLDLAPSALSKRINGETGWQEKEMDRLFEFAGFEIVDAAAGKRKLSALKETLKIILSEENQ